MPDETDSGVETVTLVPEVEKFGIRIPKTEASVGISELDGSIELGIVHDGKPADKELITPDPETPNGKQFAIELGLVKIEVSLDTDQSAGEVTATGAVSVRDPISEWQQGRRRRQGHSLQPGPRIRRRRPEAEPAELRRQELREVADVVQERDPDLRRGSKAPDRRRRAGRQEGAVAGPPGLGLQHRCLRRRPTTRTGAAATATRPRSGSTSSSATTRSTPRSRTGRGRSVTSRRRARSRRSASRRSSGSASQTGTTSRTGCTECQRRTPSASTRSTS